MNKNRIRKGDLMEATLVSIVIPIYNVEKYLEKCIESISKQTYKNIEILLIDDGSTDNSLKICKNYEKKDTRIKVIHKKNGGLSDTRNRGIIEAKGNYIMFVDSDDWIENDTVSLLLENIEKNKSDIVVFGMSIDYENGDSKLRVPKINKCFDGKTGLIYMNSFMNIDISTCNKIFKKRLFDNIEFPVGKLCEDYYTMFKIFDKAKIISILQEPKYHYFQRNNSISRNTNVNLDYKYASREQMEFISKKYPDIDYVGKTAYAFSQIAIFNMFLNRRKEFNKKEIIKDVRKYKNSILKNKYIPLWKKIQTIIFIYFNNFYCILKKYGG